MYSTDLDDVQRALLRLLDESQAGSSGAGRGHNDFILLAVQNMELVSIDHIAFSSLYNFILKKLLFVMPYIHIFHNSKQIMLKNILIVRFSNSSFYFDNSLARLSTSASNLHLTPNLGNAGKRMNNYFFKYAKITYDTIFNISIISTLSELLNEVVHLARHAK